MVLIRPVQPKICTFFVLILSLVAIAGGNRLTVDEALTRVNRVPAALANVLARMTNSVHLQVRTETDNSSRIVGGTETAIEAYPHQVALLFTGVQICGGSIISDSWVLTAAHCLDWYPAIKDISIRAGSSSRSIGGTVHPIYYYHIHEHYSPTDYPHDAATIRVRVPFSGPKEVIIPLANSEWVAGTDVTVTGWGVDGAGRTPNNLYKVTLPVVDRITCNSWWDGLITEDMICAGKTGIDSCDGDSGGPAVQSGVQYGIVSWGATVCGNGLPGIYTNIAHASIRAFIKRTTMV